MFARLFKKTSTGADQFWDISVEGSTIVTRWGQLDGKVQETRDVITEGKNVGKKNETSPEEQAIAEATSQWEKKLKKGYVKSLSDAREGLVDAVIEGGITPMLAHTIEKQGHKLKYPCLVQPKLDGHRCIAVVSGGKCTLWSRTRKPITSMPHVVKAIEDLGFEDIVLDGELYNHDYKDRFEELTSFIRDSQAKPGSEKVQYHVYDVVDDKTQVERAKFLWTEVPFTEPLVLVTTWLEVKDEDEMEIVFRECLAKGYEGAIARNMDGKYVNKRSSDLLKIKEFQDAEFLVTGVEEGRGKLAGHAIFVCKADGGEFRAKMVGDTSELKKYWDKPSLAVGKQLTVKYFGMTKYGVPRFPVALRFREDA